jgi:hypothetical protein
MTVGTRHFLRTVVTVSVWCRQTRLCACRYLRLGRPPTPSKEGYRLFSKNCRQKKSCLVPSGTPLGGRFRFVAHGEPCSGSTGQQVTTIARMGAHPGLMAFFCGECGMADDIWSLAPSAPSDEVAPVTAITEPPGALSDDFCSQEDASAAGFWKAFACPARR